jgi:DNA-binding transcriptional LysR family regulator
LDTKDLDRNERPERPKEKASTNLADVGRHLLARAHQILAESDKRLCSSNTTGHRAPIRIGISSMLLDFLVDHPAHALLDNAAVTSDICSKIVKAFDDDDVDVAMVMDVKNHRSTLGDDLVAEFDIEFAWMKTETLALEPGETIPLATWPPDQHIILNALSEDGRAYKVMFTGPDYSSKFTAVRSGKCFAVVPRNAIAPPFVDAGNDPLPNIPPKKVLLAVRGDPDSPRFKHVVSVLSSFDLAGIQHMPRQ